MVNAERIRSGLLHRDGSCRDMNFSDVSWAGVENALQLIRAQYTNVTVSGYAFGKEIPVEAGHSADIIADDDAAFIRHLAVFVYREENDSPFVELTFFPDDVQDSPDLVAQFMSFANRLAEAFGSTKWFLRYENASWHFSDCGEHSGVIFVSEVQV